VPTAYLYAPDAVERLVEMEPGLRSMLRDPAQHGDLER
jgi:4'-phosphopantetheinyl transferase